MATFAQLDRAMREAMARGQTELAKEIAKRIRERDYEEESSFGMSAAQGIASGATMGFSDEIGAGVRAALGEFADKNLGSLLYASGVGVDVAGDDERSFGQRFSDYRQGAENEQDFMQRYETALGSQRDALETARREDPWTTGIAEFVGGLSTGGVGAARATAGRGALAGLRNMAGVGAGFGGVAGYGYSEGDPLAAALADVLESDANIGDVRDELSKAVMGTTVGAGLGAGFGFALPVMGMAVRGAARFLARPFTRNARLKEAGRRQIADAIEDDVLSGNLDIKQAIRELSEHADMTLADLSPRLRAMAEDLAQTPTAGGRTIRQALRRRAEGEMRDGEVVGGQYDRIMPKISQLLGAGGGRSNFQRQVYRLAGSIRRKAGRMFDKAYAEQIEMTPDLHRILTQTALGRKSVSWARDAMQDLYGKKFQIPGIGQPVSTRAMHQVMRQMQNRVDSMFRGATKGDPSTARAVRDMFTDLVERQNPALAEARRFWGSSRAVEEAAELGRGLLAGGGKKLDNVTQQLRNMSEAGRTYFRLGVLREIEDRLGRNRDVADLTRDLLQKRNVREALRLAFGSEGKFREIMKLLQQERIYQETFEQAIGNSATARRLAQAGTDFGEKLSSLAGYGVTLGLGTGLPPSTGGYLSGAAYRALGLPRRARQMYETVAGHQANALMGQDLTGIMRPHTMAGLLGTGVPTSVAAGTGGLLASGTFTP